MFVLNILFGSDSLLWFLRLLASSSSPSRSRASVTLIRPLRLAMNLTASVCTFSSELIACLQTGPHTTSAYSRIGLQRLVKAKVFPSIDASWSINLIAPRSFLALAILLSMWESKHRSCCKITPRYLVSSTLFLVVFPSL